MDRKGIFALTWAMGMMISPEALILQGKFAGLNGLFFIWPFLGAMGLHWLNISGYRRFKYTGNPQHKEIDLLAGAFGRYLATVILLSTRPALAVVMATATLVTAGFVFNETFLYWFPNFAFAGILLAVVLGLNLAGPNVAAAAQVLFTAASLLGILGLGLAGILSGGPSAPPFLGDIPLAGGYGIFIAAILFLGYDLARYTCPDADGDQQARGMLGAVLLVGAVFFLWNIAALKFVELERLSMTGIPHILVAKAIAGDTGRYVIGMAGISGSLAVVNYLFFGVSRMGSLMAQRRLLPDVIGRITARPIFPPIGLSALTAILMALGFAGSEYIDICIYGGLLLWLILQALTHLAILLNSVFNHGNDPRRFAVGGHWASLLVLIFASGSAVGLILYYFDPKKLVYVITVIVLAAACIAALGRFVIKAFDQTPVESVDR